jgi:hypothetical protein
MKEGRVKSHRIIIGVPDYLGPQMRMQVNLLEAKPVGKHSGSLA